MDATCVLKVLKIQCVWNGFPQRLPAIYAARKYFGVRGGAPLLHYNFCRIHQTLRETGAMETVIRDHVCELR
jgi:hypothetical protein